MDYARNYQTLGCPRYASEDRVLCRWWLLEVLSDILLQKCSAENLGEVSHKSVVYSYGMMLLEMVGGRNENLNVEANRSSEMYFNDQVYQLIEEGQDKGLDRANCKKDGSGWRTVRTDNRPQTETIHGESDWDVRRKHRSSTNPFKAFLVPSP